MAAPSSERLRLRADTPGLGFRCRGCLPALFNPRTVAWDGNNPEGGVQWIAVNCVWSRRRRVEAWVGTAMHELSHAAGYRHHGEARAGNECSVPHLVGDLAEHRAFEILRARGEARDSRWTISDDVCPVLREVIGAVPDELPR